VWDLLGACALRKTDSIDGEAVTCENALFFAEEAATRRGVVGHEEIDGDGSDDRSNAFKDLVLLKLGYSEGKWETNKQPPPPWKTTNIIHVIGNDACEKAGGCSSERDRGIQQGISCGKLISTIPRGEEEGAPWGEPGLQSSTTFASVYTELVSLPTSAKPSRNRIPANCDQFCVAPISAANVPQTSASPGRNTLGRTRVKIILAGTSKIRYEMKKTSTMMEYCDEVRLKSSSIPPVLALLETIESVRAQHGFS
jgi:hypothetical protein